MDERSDEELVAAYERGEVAAFEALYRRYRGWVLDLAWRFTRNRDDALDVLQAVFEYWLRKFPGFELRARLTTFLYPAVRNLAIQYRRKSRRLSSREELEEPAVPAPDVTASAARVELTAALSGLSAAHREVLLMRFVDDMSLEEIAAALEIPTGTVKSRLHHALRALRADPRVCERFGLEM